MSRFDADNLPEGWTLVCASDVCEINPRKHAADVLPAESPVTFSPMAAVDEDLGAIATPEDRPFGELRPKSFTPFAEGDVLFAKITPCMENGKAAVARGLTNGLGFGTTEFHVFRSRGAVIPEYLYHFIRQQSFRDHARSHMAGAVGQLRVPADYVKQFEFPLPPLAEQRRIVAKVEVLLARVRSVRKRLAAVPAILKHFRQSILAHACSGKLTEDCRDGQVSNDAEDVLGAVRKSRPTRFRDNNGGRIRELIPPLEIGDLDCPDEWPITSLDELTCLVTSGARGWARYYSSDGPLFIRAQNISTDWLDLEGVAHVSPPESTEGERTQVERSDLLITITGANVTKSAWVTEDIGQAYVSQHVALTRPVLPTLAPFLYLWTISRQHGRAKLERDAYGAGKPGLNLTQIREMPVALPSLTEQHEIVRRVEALFALADSIEQHVAAAAKRTEALTQSILARAFRGELVPTEAELAEAEGREYETAEQLLARVHTASPTKATTRGRSSRRKAAVGKQGVDPREGLLALMLLLDAWKRPVHRRWLDAGIVLWLNPMLRRQLLGKTTPKGTVRSGGKVRHQPALDILLKNLADSGAVTITETARLQAIALHDGFDRSRLNPATKADRTAAQEAIQVLEKLNERDAMSLLPEMSDVELELVS